jgi:hypothetical protein
VLQTRIFNLNSHVAVRHGLGQLHVKAALCGRERNEVQYVRVAQVPVPRNGSPQHVSSIV